jgi:hypothetical protein
LQKVATLDFFKAKIKGNRTLRGQISLRKVASGKF